MSCPAAADGAGVVGVGVGGVDGGGVVGIAEGGPVVGVLGGPYNVGAPVPPGRYPPVLDGDSADTPLMPEPPPYVLAAGVPARVGVLLPTLSKFHCQRHLLPSAT